MSISVLAMSELVASALAEHGSQFAMQHLPVVQASNRPIRGIAATGDAPIDAALLATLPALEIVSLYGAGYDGIDLTALRAHNIVVANTPDVLSADVADLAIALWICVARRIVEADRFARAGRWADGPIALAHTASQRSAGILGLGRIGAAIARRCDAMDMVVHYCSRTKRPDARYRHWNDLAAMAAEVDVLFVACPGGPATRRLVDETVIDRLGPDGTLINVSRGTVVDEAAMTRALLDGRLGGAGLDVYEQEPRIPASILGLPGVVLTPHVGSATVETRRAMGWEMVQNLVRHFAGEPVRNRIA